MRINSPREIVPRPGVCSALIALASASKASTSLGSTLNPRFKLSVAGRTRGRPTSDSFADLRILCDFAVTVSIVDSKSPGIYLVKKENPSDSSPPSFPPFWPYFGHVTPRPSLCSPMNCLAAYRPGQPTPAVGHIAGAPCRGEAAQPRPDSAAAPAMS